MRRPAIAVTSLALMAGSMVISPAWAQATDATSTSNPSLESIQEEGEETRLTNTDELVLGWSIDDS